MSVDLQFPALADGVTVNGSTEFHIQWCAVADSRSAADLAAALGQELHKKGIRSRVKITMHRNPRPGEPVNVGTVIVQGPPLRKDQDKENARKLEELAKRADIVAETIRNGLFKHREMLVPKTTSPAAMTRLRLATRAT